MSKNVGHFLNYLLFMNAGVKNKQWKCSNTVTLALLPEERKSEKVDILLECLVSAAFD